MPNRATQTSRTQLRSEARAEHALASTRFPRFGQASRHPYDPSTAVDIGVDERERACHVDCGREPALPLDTVREQLDTLGYAVVRGFVSGDEVREMGEAFERLLTLAQTLPGTGDHHGAHFVLEPNPFRVHRVVWAGGADATLARYGDDPRFLNLAAALLGSRDLVQLVQQAHYKMPGDGVAFRWHQDASNRRYGTDLWTDVDGCGSYLQMTLAVDAMHERNGPLEVIPGSHRHGFIAEPDTGDIDPRYLDAERVPSVLEPGDLALFGPFLLHGSGENTSARPRRLFLQGYTLPGANQRVYPGSGTGVPRRAPNPAAALLPSR